MTVPPGAPVRPKAGRADEAGWSYVEALIATAIVALALVPAVDSLMGGGRGAALHREVVARHYHLRALLEDVLAQPFADLERSAARAGSPSVATDLSDPAGSAVRRVVHLAPWDGDDADGDGDPWSGADAGLLWVRVRIEGIDASLETLVSD